MTVTLASMFRDSERYLLGWYSQVAELACHVDLRVVAAEGDSHDGTYDALTKLARGPIPLTVIKADHGGIAYGSVDHPQRWGQIATVVRTMFGQIDDPGDVFIWVESDLRWDADTMLRLAKNLDEVPAVAPMVMADTSRRFYDTYGFRKDGERFMAWPPYYYEEHPDGLVKIDSCGSCFVARGELWPELRDWDGLWPCPVAGQLWLDPTCEVSHP